MPEPTPPPPLTLAGSTFRCYRLTPLHSTTASSSSSSSSSSTTTKKQTDTQKQQQQNPPLSTPQNLTHHANRFASFVRGDVLRGVRVSEDVNRNLESCVFEPFTISTSTSTTTTSTTTTTTTTTIGGIEGIAVTLKFTRGAYNAFLLKQQSSSQEGGERGKNGGGKASVWYPLLLTRMPAGLLSVFTEYIGAHFDTHVSALKVVGGSNGGGGDDGGKGGVNSFMRNVLEGYIRNIAGRRGGEGEVKRDIQIVFEPPGLSLNDNDSEDEGKDDDGGDIEKEVAKAVEGKVSGIGGVEKTKKMTTLHALTLTVAKGDVLNFEKVGKRILKDSSQTGKDNNNKRNGEKEGPFMAGFEHYALEVLGVHLDKMTLAKVSCADFVLAVNNGGDGSVRCKFFDGGVGSLRRVGEERVDDDEEDGTSEGDWKGLLVELLKRAGAQF